MGEQQEAGHQVMHIYMYLKAITSLFVYVAESSPFLCVFVCPASLWLENARRVGNGLACSVLMHIKTALCMQIRIHKAPLTIAKLDYLFINFIKRLICHFGLSDCKFLTLNQSTSQGFMKLSLALFTDAKNRWKLLY